MASKAEQIIDHFTKDAALKAKVLKIIADLKGKREVRDVNRIIARFTTDPALTAKIKEIIKKIRAGHSYHAVAGYHHADVKKAHRAGNAMHAHRGAVEHILRSKS